MLQEANDSKKTPLPSITATRFSIEAMLAHLSYDSGVLKSRIDKAIEDNVLPNVMGEWAHEVRLFGNEGHTDEAPADLPTFEEAEHVLTYANTLAEYLFVLPARIKKARKVQTGNAKSSG